MRKAKNLTTDRSTNFDKYLPSSVRLNRNLNINATSTGVEIIELDKSTTSESDDDVYNMERQQAWCCADMNVHRMQDDNYSINKKAREKWRMKNKVHPGFLSKGAGYSSHENRDINSNCAHTGSLNSVWGSKRDTQSINTLNCFTIVRNDIDDSDSSSDKENSIEITECGDVVLERNQLSSDENLKKMNYNNRMDNTRTILIYSFKNRNVLGEDDNQPFNSSEESTSEDSIKILDSLDEKNISKNRVPSPSPAPYIPRLDFFAAATLPTVAEVAEPNHFTSENIKSHKNNTPKVLTSERPFLESNGNKLQDEFLHKRQEFESPIHPPISSSNIINWMGLSPRKQIREFKVPDPNKENLIFVENVISSVQNAKYSVNRDDAITSTDKSDLETDIEKHLDVNDATDDHKILEEINNTFSIDEKGDHKKVKRLKKPQICLEKITTNSMITEPIEKLNGDKWIDRESEHIDKPDFDLDVSRGSNVDMNKPKLSNRCAGDRLFIKNMSLLKPVEWAEYLPITESIPSLHLSLPSDINEGKRSWFKRFIKFVQRCIKWK